MDCQPCCTSSLPRIWAIETLACSNQVDVSLLLDLLEKTPEISHDVGKNARELVSLKILESLFIQGGRANPVSSTLSQTRLDPSDCCEYVLRRILSGTSPSHMESAGPEMSKWDLEPFIEHKRSSLCKYALKQLKDAILMGSHFVPAALKEQSGLPVGHQAEHEAPVKDGNCNGITSRVEGNDTNDSYLLPGDLPNGNLLPVNRKRRATSESAAGNLCTTHINLVKKYKHDIITEQYVGGKLISSGVDRQIADMCTLSVQHTGGIRCSFGTITHVGSMRLNEPPKDDNDEHTSSKGLVGPDEAVPCGKQVPHCDTELNSKFEEEQGQDQNIEKAKGGKKGFCDLKRSTEDVDKFEQNIQNFGEVEEHVHISNNDGNNDDRTDIAGKENASFGPNCTYSQDLLATTNDRDQNLLAGTSKRYSEEERCLEKITPVEVMGQNGPSGDGNNHFMSSKGLVGNDAVLPHEKQSPRCGVEVPNENFDEAMQDSKDENTENGQKGLPDLITANKDMDNFDQNATGIASTAGQAEEDRDISSDNDGYHDERTNIDAKKKTFLSSQCTYSQESLATTDLRELHLCMKCNKGEKLLSCGSNSCPLLIHESCLGSDASFDTSGKFFCPFCAYSRAISRYMEVKKKASLARKDLAAFICLGAQQESNKQSQRSFRMEGDHLEQGNGLPKSNELNQRDVVEKVKNRRRGKKLEYEQGGPSELQSGYSPPFGGKAVDSTNRLAQGLKEKQDGKGMRQVSQPLRGNGLKPISALAIHNSECETTSCRVPETSRSEEISEEESEDSGTSKYFIRVRKPERQNLYPAIPQLRRKRHPWTSEEEAKLKEGMRIYCGPHNKVIPWKRILDFGDGVFQPSRSTMDLKDKWRNMCKASPKSK